MIFRTQFRSRNNIYASYPDLVGIEKRSDKIPMELQSLLTMSLDSISGAIKDVHNRPNFNIFPTDDKVKKAQLVFTDLPIDEKSPKSSKPTDEQVDISVKLAKLKLVKNEAENMPKQPEFRRECFDLATHSPLYKFQIMSERGEKRTVQRTELITIPDPRGYQPILESSRKFLANSKRKQNRTETMVKDRVVYGLDSRYADFSEPIFPSFKFCVPIVNTASKTKLSRLQTKRRCSVPIGCYNRNWSSISQSFHQ